MPIRNSLFHSTIAGFIAHSSETRVNEDGRLFSVVFSKSVGREIVAPALSPSIPHSSRPQAQSAMASAASAGGPAFSESVPQPSSYMRIWEWCEVKINLPGASQMATEKLIQRYFVRNKSRVGAAGLTATAVAWSILDRRGVDCGSLHDQSQRKRASNV